MNEDQIAFLERIGIDPNSDLDVIEEQVGDYLEYNCLDTDYNPTADGLLCENILDYISEQQI